MSTIKFGNRIMIEVPLGISWQYKYMIIDTKQTTLVKGLDALIGQLTGIKYYYEDLEEKATLERVEEFQKETHLAYVMSPAYEPKFDFTLLVDGSATEKDNKISNPFKEHMITE
jgi:hypothetical protein